MTIMTLPRRIALFDPCPYTRQGVASLCEVDQTLSLTIAHGSLGEFRQQLQHTPCDVLVMEISCPVYQNVIPGVFALIEQVHQTQPGTPIIIWSHSDNLMALYRRMYRHPWIMLRKKAPVTSLLQALRQASPVLTGELILKPLITYRERRVLMLYLAGHSASFISRLLRISIKTVYSHKLNVLKKSGLLDGKEYQHLHPLVIMRTLPVLMDELRSLKIYRGYHKAQQ